MSNRRQVRKIQREMMNSNEKKIAKQIGMPKGMRQYCKRLGSLPSIVEQEMRKWPF